MTRARDELRLIYKSAPSSFVQAMWRGLSPVAVEIETSSPAAAAPVEATTGDDKMISSPATEAAVLNGRSVIPVPREPTQAELAEALGTTGIQIANYAYTLGVFPTGTSRFSDHHVISIFDRWGAVPLFRRTTPKADPTRRTSKWRAPRPVVRTEIPNS
jgi:hypothetical protein